MYYRLDKFLIPIISEEETPANKGAENKAGGEETEFIEHDEEIVPFLQSLSMILMNFNQKSPQKPSNRFF